MKISHALLIGSAVLFSLSSNSNACVSSWDGTCDPEARFPNVDREGGIFSGERLPQYACLKLTWRASSGSCVRGCQATSIGGWRLRGVEADDPSVLGGHCMCHFCTQSDGSDGPVGVADPLLPM